MDANICDRFGGEQSNLKCHGCFYNKNNNCNYHTLYVKPKSLDEIIDEMKE